MDNKIKRDMFDIDLTRLDEEWIGQPKLFFKYASELVDAKRQVEEAKAELDVNKAKLDQAIRNNPEGFGLIKITESSISNAIILQPEYQEALKSITKSKYKADLIQAAVSALDHRKSALERLVSLHGQNYFATPTPQDIASKEQVERIEKEIVRRKLRHKRENKAKKEKGDK